jgi:hypothetical protein
MISSRVTHCQQPGSSIGTQPRAKLFREEPEAGNLHIRVCNIELVREEFHRPQHHAEGTPEKKHQTRKKAFNRAVKSSKDRNVVATREVDGVQLIWLTSPQAGQKT